MLDHLPLNASLPQSTQRIFIIERNVGGSDGVAEEAVGNGGAEPESCCGVVRGGNERCRGAAGSGGGNKRELLSCKPWRKGLRMVEKITNDGGEDV